MQTNNYHNMGSSVTGVKRSYHEYTKEEVIRGFVEKASLSRALGVKKQFAKKTLSYWAFLVEDKYVQS